MEFLAITICLILFFLICLFRLDFGFFVLVALLPTYLIRFKVGFLPMTFLEGMILILFFSWLITRIFKKDLFLVLRSSFSLLEKTKCLIPIILFIVAATISIFVSPNLKSAAGIWKAYFIEPLLLFLVFISTINKRQIRLILSGLGISAIWVSVIGIYQKFTGWAIPDPLWQAEATRRVTSVYGYPNALGLYLGPIIVLYIGILKSKVKLIITSYKLLAIILSLLAIIFAKSHGAWLGALAGILFLGFLSKKRKWFLLALIILVLLFLIPQTRSKILDWAGYEENIGVRIDMWKDSFRLGIRSLIFGTGLAGFQSIYEKYREVKHFGLFPYPHNIVLNFWLEIGLFGLIAFVWLVVRFFKIGFSILRKALQTSSSLLTAGLLGSLVCLIVHGLVDVPYFKNDLSVQFWIFFGLLMALTKEKR